MGLSVHSCNTPRSPPVAPCVPNHSKHAQHQRNRRYRECNSETRHITFSTDETLTLQLISSGNQVTERRDNVSNMHKCIRTLTRRVHVEVSPKHDRKEIRGWKWRQHHPSRVFCMMTYGHSTTTTANQCEQEKCLICTHLDQTSLW